MLGDAGSLGNDTQPQQQERGRWQVRGQQGPGWGTTGGAGSTEARRAGDSTEQGGDRSGSKGDMGVGVAPGASGLVGASVGARLASPKNIALKIDFPIISVDDGGRARAKSACASGV